MPKSSTLAAGLLFLALITLALALNGCGGPIATPPCSPALACATIDHLTSGGGCPNIQDKGFFKGGNKHPTKTIIVTYEVDGIALSPPPPSPPPSFVMYTVSPGVANEIELGCAMTENPVGSGKYDSYTYTPVAACFQGDPSCVGETDVSSSNAPASCCSQPQCQSPDCIDYSFNSVPGDPEEAAARAATAKAISDLLSPSGPTSVSLAALLGLNNTCPSNGPLVIGNNSFQETGSSCDVVLPARATPPLGVHVYVPSYLSGGLKIVPSTIATFDFPNRYQSVTLEWLDGNGTSLGFEYVAHIEVVPGLVKIVGSRHYCIWIHTGETLKIRKTKK